MKWVKAGAPGGALRQCACGGCAACAPDFVWDPPVPTGDRKCARAAPALYPGSGFKKASTYGLLCWKCINWKRVHAAENKENLENESAAEGKKQKSR